MAKEIRRRKRFWKRRQVWIPELLLLCLILTRNLIAHALIERVGSSVLGNDISIGKVQLGLTHFEIVDIRINEPDSDENPQLIVKRVELFSASFGNICKGVYLNELAVDSPELHLWFDAEGKLLSRFPEVPSSDKPAQKPVIPLEKLSVSNARLIVHQAGKPAMTIVAEGLTVDIGERIHVKGLLSNFFSGKLKFTSNVNAESFAGKSSLAAVGVELNSSTLAELPLIPSVVAQEQLSATAEFSLTMIHPPDEPDLRSHSLNLIAQLRDIQGEAIDGLPNELIVAAENEAGQLKFELKTNPLAGSAVVKANANLFETPLQVKANATVSNVKLHRLKSLLEGKFGALPPFKITGGMDVTAKVTLDNEAIGFDCKLATRASKMSVDEISINDLTGSVEAKGSYSLHDPTRVSQLPLSGHVIGKVDWDGVSLDQLKSKIEQFDATGHVNGGVRFKIPLDRITDVNSFVANCEINATKVASHGLSLSDTSVTATLADGKLNVQLPRTELLDSMTRQIATFSGSVRSGLSRDSKVVGHLDANDLTTKSIVRVLGRSDENIDGVVTVSATAVAPLQSLANPAEWAADAKLECRGLVLEEERLSDFTGLCFVRNGKIQIPEVTIQWRNTFCRLDLNGRIDKDRSVEGKFSATPILLSDLSKAASRFSKSELPLKGSAEVSGSFRVSAYPVQFLATGKSQLTDATCAKYRIGNAEVNWHADQFGLQFNYDSSDLLGGTCSVIANVNDLDWTQTALSGKFQDIPAKRLIAMTELHLPTTGVFDGGFQCHSIESVKSLKGNAWVRSRGVAVRGMNFEIAEGTLLLDEGQATLISRGKVAAGSYDVTAKCKLNELIAFGQRKEPKLHDIPVTAEFKLNKARVERLVVVAGLNSQLAPLEALVSLRCVRDESSADEGLIGKATVTTENISWNHSRLSEYITGEIALRPDRATLHQLRGRFADGQVNGSAEVTIEGVPRGTFRFSATNVNLRRVSTPFAGAGVASGSGSVYVNGRIDSTITGRLNANLYNANLSGISVRRARLPVDWSYSRKSGVARWNCRAGSVEAGSGRIHLDSEGSFGRALTMNNSVRVERVNTSKLMRGSSLGVGIIDGACTLQSRRATSLEQFTGTFDLQLSDARAMEMPILSQLPRMIKLPSLSSGGAADDGDYLYGRLGGGLIHLEELAISQSNVNVLMNGTSTLDGRLNLNITASTENSGPIDDLLSLADSPLMTAGAAPIALVARANEALKNRVVHVEVRGTASHPTMQLQPGKQLSQDAVRFFLNSTVGTRIANSASSQQKGRRQR